MCDWDSKHSQQLCNKLGLCPKPGCIGASLSTLAYTHTIENTNESSLKSSVLGQGLREADQPVGQGKWVRTR